VFEESKMMKELHEIREKIYEETKHMSSKEMAQYFNEKAKKAKRDLKLKNNVL
jgi:ribosomal protein L29